MPTIYVPTFPAFRKDVETMLSVLEKEVDGFGIGLEIGGRPDHFSSQEGLDKIVENMKRVAGGIPTVVHGFSGLEVYEIDGKKSDIADMSKPTGLNLLKTYIDLAKQLGSHYVHVHGAAGWQRKEVGEGFKGLSEVVSAQTEARKRIRANLLEGLKYAGKRIKTDIGIENLPDPSACDFSTDDRGVWRDYVQHVSDCIEIVKGTDLKITFDIAHHGINKDGYVDLVDASFGTFAPASEVDHLYHLHVGDCSGYWKPGVSKAYDGVIPGEGRIGKDSFARFFKYIRETHPDIGICLEVHNKSFDDPQETRESIKRVCNWLKAA